MVLVYRTAWQDDRVDLIRDAALAFSHWADEKELGPGQELDLRALDVRARRAALDSVHDATSYVFAPATGVLGLECRLVESQGAERWTTILRVSVNEETSEQWIGVDVDWTAADPFRSIYIAAPRLVRDLITSSRQQGGNPRISDVVLNADAEGIATAKDAKSRIVPLISAIDRRVPIVLFSHDEEEHDGRTATRAHRAAEHLAGVALVYLLTPDAGEALDAALDDLSVWGGAARLYLPGSLDPWRHRFLTRQYVQKHDAAAAMRFSLMLKDFVPAIELPDQLGAIDPRSTLERTETEELGETILQLQTVRSELRDALNKAKDYEDRYYWALDEQRGAQEEADGLRRQLLVIQHERDTTIADSKEWDLLASPATIDEAIGWGEVRLSHVEIHPDASIDIEELDSALESETWAKSIWLGLRALNQYAKRPQDFSGGFWEWCQHAAGSTLFAWPASNKKLAMYESETVKNDERLNHTRLFPVDPKIHPSGKIHMYAHLKIAEGGGQNIPRLYFHDDTRRPKGTGKIHVGFIGPHSEVPNKNRR